MEDVGAAFEVAVVPEQLKLTLLIPVVTELLILGIEVRGAAVASMLMQSVWKR